MEKMNSVPLYQISPSQFRVHKECPQLHKFVYELGLRTKQREKKFEVGSYFHELAHFYYQLLKAGYHMNDPLTFSAMDTKMRNDLAEVKDDYLAVLCQVHIMFRRYLERRVKEIDQGIEIIEVEKEINFPISESAGIHGIVDMLYRRRGKLVIRDHKTGENQSAHSDESLEMDDQLLTYACIIWKIYGEVPDIEISWINAKTDYKNGATNDQLFRTYHKAMTKEYLQAFWTYTEQYVYHMQTVPAIRYINGYKCKSCKFKEPCMFSLRGFDIRNMLEANYQHVPRNHDYRKFTEIARKNPTRNTVDPPSKNIPSGRISIDFFASHK
jgi:hypothetical protein